MAVRIDAANDRLTAAVTLPAVTAGITVTGWINRKVNRGDFSTWLRLHTGGTGGGSTVITSGTGTTGTSAYGYYTGGGSIEINQSVPQDTWVPVAVTHDTGTTGKSYARLSGTTFVASGTVGGGTPTGITLGGRDSTDATEWFNGEIAHFRIWSGELTQAEIEAEWASPTPVKTSGLLYNWPLYSYGDYTDTVASKVLVTQSGSLTAAGNGPFLGSKNLMPNPSAKIDLTGWSGALNLTPGTNNQTAAVVRETGLLAKGFPVDTGFRYTAASGYSRSAQAPVTPGQTYTVSFWGLHPSTNGLATCYLVWYNADGSDNSYNNFGGFGGAVNSNHVHRKAMTIAAPAGAVAVGTIIDGSVDCIVSAFKVEEGSFAFDYADGDTPGWQWNGTSGLSSSQPTVGGPSPVSGALAGSLPTPGGALAGTVRTPGAVAGSLPTPTGTLTGDLAASGLVAGALPTLGGTFTGAVFTPGVVAGALPVPGGTLTGVLRASGALSGELPALSGALTGVIASLGIIRGVLPTLGGSLNDLVTLLTQDQYALEVHRENTRAFIAADPFSVTLRTRTDVRTATGGRVMADGSFRSPQIGKLIMVSPAGGSIEQRTQDGTERQVDFILLLEWDAEIEVGDWWDDQLGNRWEVKALIPTNNYEVRAVVEAHGKQMTGG